MTVKNCVYFTHDWHELRAWLSGNFLWRLLPESQHWLEIVFTKFLSYISNGTVKIHLYLSKNIGKMHIILIKVSANTDFGIN